MEFQWSHFKSWKMMLWKCCTPYASTFGKLSSGHRTGKGQFSFQSQRKAMPKSECSNYRTIALISQASKVMLKILQARLQQCVNRELPDVQAGFKRQRNQRSNCQHPLDHGKSKRVPLTMPKPLIVWITINCGKFWKRWEYQTSWSDSWEICMQVRKQELELDMEQQTGSNRKRSTSRLYIVTLLI